MPNQYWQDRILKNQEMADRLANKAVQRQAALHKDLYKDLARQVDSLFIEVTNAGVQNISRTQLWQFSKWKALMDKNYAGFNTMAKTQITIMESLLEEVFYQTQGVTLQQLGRKDIAFNIIHSKQMMQLLNEQWSGNSYSSRIWRNAEAISIRIREDCTRLIQEGKNPAQIKAGLMEDFNVSYNNADRLVRTESAYVFSEASKAAYVEAGVQLMEFIIAEDERTCETCQEKGNADQGYGKGIYPINTCPIVPHHPKCRCVYAPIVTLSQ